MPPHPLTNFDIQMYYQNRSKINGVYLINNFPKINVINLEKYKSIWTDCIAWHVYCNNRISSYDAIYFDGFGVELTPKEI